MLNDNSIPILSKDVITRRDSNGVLIFQVRTDEMHFLSENAFALLTFCNGSRTIREIEKLVAGYQPEPSKPTSKNHVVNFLESLIDRRVLEIWR
jgi:hypothetical protein